MTMTMKVRTAFVMTAAAIGVAASALPAQAATQYVYQDRVTTASGANYCDFTLKSSGANFEYHTSKTLSVITRGTTYTCNVQIRPYPDDGRVLNYPDAPGNGTTTYTFSYPITEMRACQNGNPGRCGSWLNKADATVIPG